MRLRLPRLPGDDAAQWAQLLLARARAWGLAALAGMVGALLRAVLQPVLGNDLPFIVAFPVTAFAALMWGTGGGLLAALMCGIAVAVPLVPPEVADMPMQLGGYALSAIIVSLICGQMGGRRVLQKAPVDAAAPDTALTVWLRAVLWGAVLIPLTAFVMAAWWGFERAQGEAHLTAARASDLALRQAERTFAVAAEIARRADAAASGDDAGARENEAEIHRRLADMVAGLPSVVNLNVWDAGGRPIARSDLYPVDIKASVLDRAYFTDQRDRPQPLGVSEVIKGRQTGRELLNATVRRASPDGAFRGIVAVSLAPQFFRDYYRSLASEEPDLATFALVRTDGALLARWPPAPDQRVQVPTDSPILARVRAGERAGDLVLPASPGRETRLVSFRRVGDYPLYVVAGFSQAAMLAGWFRYVGLLAAVLVPITAGLVYVTWVALKKTRREQAVSGALRDEIQRRAIAERSMLEGQKLETLAQLTGGVAHDFNNLLAVVNTSLHVHRRLHPDVAGESQLEAMSRAIQSGVRLTRQLLSFSRKQALKPETVQLQVWLPASEGLIRSTLGPRIVWEVQVAPDTWPIHVDLAELELALINLVLNAKQAMPDGGRLHVAAHNAAPDGAARPMVVISVEDEGQGIPAEVLPRVFEPFFTTREKGSGSGLGLSQVRGLCAQAGGYADIRSTPGLGTTVCMHLPAVFEGDEAPAGAEPAAPAAVDGRVLLVEDHDDVAVAIEAMLRLAGLQVVRVPTASAALTYLANAAMAPDLVLSDIAMPGPMNGIAMAVELRARRPGLPVLLTTGYAEQLAEALAEGFVVLAKPVPPELLLGEIRRLVQAAAGGSADPASRVTA